MILQYFGYEKLLAQIAIFAERVTIQVFFLLRRLQRLGEGERRRPAHPAKGPARPLGTPRRIVTGKVRQLIFEVSLVIVSGSRLPEGAESLVNVVTGQAYVVIHPP